MKFIFFAYFIHALLGAKVEDINSHVYTLGKNLVENLNADKNVLVSPYLADNALLLAAAGSSGKTFKEFLQVLNLKEKDYKDSKSIVADERLVNLHTAVKPFLSSNSIWVSKKLKLNADFDKTTEKFNSSVISADFSPKVIVPKINSYISDRTSGKFSNVVDKIDASSLYLINTLLFNGNWQYPFTKSESRTGQFVRLDKSSEEAVYMEQKQELNYFTDKEIAAAILPFSSGPNLLVIKPQAEGDKALQSVVKTLTFDKVDTILSKAKRLKLNVTLPRLSTSLSVSLKEVLKKLGLNIAFTSKADFSLITPKSAPVGDVLQEVVFGVDEDGTAADPSSVVEAAAPPAKGKKEKEKEKEKKKEKLTEFTIDRPFVFVLLDGKTPLFEGVIRTVGSGAATSAKDGKDL